MKDYRKEIEEMFIDKSGHTPSYDCWDERCIQVLRIVNKLEALISKAQEDLIEELINKGIKSPGGPIDTEQVGYEVYTLYCSQFEKSLKGEKKIIHVNPNCKDASKCNPHSEFGSVTYKGEKK